MQKIRTAMPKLTLTLRSLSFWTVTTKILVMTAAVVSWYFQDLSILFTGVLQDEALTHTLVVPLLFLYLVYRKRKILKATILAQHENKYTTLNLQTVFGILLSATAIVLYWYGSYTFTPVEYHMLTLPVFAAGLTLILFNIQTLRQLALPLAFLVFLTPPPIEILYGLGSALSVFSSEASNAIANALGVPSTISGEYGNPTIIITRPDQSVLRFTVDIACSGIYSLIGFVMFAAFIAYISRHKTWKRLAILLSGIPLIFFLNVIRISTILVIGYNFGEQLALQVFHIVGAWVLMFIGTLVLLLVSEKVLKKPLPVQQCSQCISEPSENADDVCSACGRLLKYPMIKLSHNDLTKIIAATIAMTVLLSLQAPVFATATGAIPVFIQTPNGEQGNIELLPQIQGYTLKFAYRDRNFEQLAKQDASIVFSYTPDDPRGTPVWLTLEMGGTISSLHRWETCLITWPQTHGYQPRVAQLKLSDIQIMENPPITARYFAFQYFKTNQIQLVLYWYETSIFAFDGEFLQEKVKISLITFPETPEDVEEKASILEPFANAIVAHWQPMKTWNQIALLISQNGLSLAA